MPVMGTADPSPFRIIGPHASSSIMSRTVFFLCCLLSIVACGQDTPAADGGSAGRPGTQEIPFHADGTLDLLRGGQPYTTLRIEVAATDSARERGLMQRPPLTDDQGMLFVFDFAGPQTFWMANTPSSLDIIFAGADSTVVNVARYTQPFSTQGVSSEGPARFVLETAAGFADRHDVAPGDRLRWRSASEPE